jgi:hypothetical protein
VTAGVYRVSGNIEAQGGSLVAGDYAMARIHVNGLLVNAAFPSVPVNLDVSVCATCILSLNANDFVELFVQVQHACNVLGGQQTLRLDLELIH